MGATKRSANAAAQPPEGAALPPVAARVLGVPVWGLRMGEFLELAVDRIRAREKTLFTTANAHSIVLAQRHPGLAAHFEHADVVLPDGILSVLGGRACGGDLPERVAGPDFFEAFLERAGRERISVFLLGTTDETLAAIRRRCNERVPALMIRGTVAPPFGDIDEETDRRLVEAVNAANPDALFVAMTAPKQELWLSRNFGSLSTPFAMGVGAAFDFFAGRKKRAPRIVGRLGLEWLFRFMQEPRRLWRRQLSSVVFIARLLRERLKVAPRRRERGSKS